MQHHTGAEIQGGAGGAQAPQKFLLRELGTPKINAPCVKLNARSGKWVSILLSSLAESHAFSCAAGEARSGLRRRGSTWFIMFLWHPQNLVLISAPVIGYTIARLMIECTQNTKYMKYKIVNWSEIKVMVD